jgi:hypothetical protein
MVELNIVQELQEGNKLKYLEKALVNASEFVLVDLDDKNT